jgi:hypothetical protein
VRTVYLRSLFCLSAFSLTAQAQSDADYERPPINYSASTPADAVTRLQARLLSGAVTLTGDERHMLTTVLTELDVPVASQLLVFSRTSFQRTRIHPDQPRALYFSDSVYVGWVPGGLVEVIAIDPTLGPIFYTLKLPRGRTGSPVFVRDPDCLRCHGGTFVREIPGLFVRSLFPDTEGDPLLRHGTQLVDDTTPFAERWGGWYVTGYHGTEPHRGNAMASENGSQLVFTPATARPDNVSAFFDPSAYLLPTSDVVALLINEHQMNVQNRLTHAAFAVRRIIEYQHSLQTAFKEALTDEPAYDSVRSVLTGAVQEVVDQLLFRDAVPLPPGITGSTAFRESFLRSATRSRSGHSLRDLELGPRLFAQRCSYMIYSDAFASLPTLLKNRVLDRLHEVLLSRDASDRYAYLPAEEKQRIYTILDETLPAATARWSPLAAARVE